eukprot:CAMPEP_0115151278 /NCGR_PEP_ID=MMETSP0227-20121206/65506_1 /TAXON_ID=89957 /ORGANISM="Polarella glacialis, Strain CCMP 1383" /LENGTH=899 /DNA_ID=CAMNT_0002561737 /DNA_START=48 /DNA_END=2748 /DNA_ORIENTATION=-
MAVPGITDAGYPVQMQTKASEPEPENGAVERLDLEQANGATHGGYLVVTVQGPNGPNRMAPFIAIIGKMEHQARIVDMAQYVIENSLVFSLMLEHGADSSISLIKELVTTSRNLNLNVSFSFGGGPDPNGPCPWPVGGAPPGSHPCTEELIASINVAVKGSLPAMLLHEMFEYLANTGGKLLEVKHKRDDRFSFNKECTKVSLRVRCPGVPISELYLNLQRICRVHSAEVAVREWEGMDRPNGKSLVVFGLSDVLCPYDVLDKVLVEAGIDPATVKCGNCKDSGAKAKVAALRGKDAVCMQRAAEKLEFTKGARLVCHSLKEIGFRLAVISSTGCRLILERVKQELGLDYAISRDLEVDKDNTFTGQYAGDHKEEGTAFNKADYLQLMAERDGIDLKNVILVGTFTQGMSDEAVRLSLDTFGPSIHFHAPESKKPCLLSMLYLLGFSGFDVDEMQCQRLKQEINGQALKEVIPEADVMSGASSPKMNPEYLLEVGVRVRCEGNDLQSFAQLMEPLIPFCKAGTCTIERIQQVTLMSENALMGLSLTVNGLDPEAALKDMLLQSHRLGLTVDWDEQDSEQAMVPRTQYMSVTVVQRPVLQASRLAVIFQSLALLRVDITRFERLSEESNFSALQITAIVPPESQATLRGRLLALSKELEVDIAFQMDGIERWGRRMVVFDMDSTLIQQEVIDELAKQCGVEDVVGEITERAMRGELDFHQSLRERVALLKGHNSEKLFNSVIRQLVYTPGALQLCRTLKRLGYKMAVISGGFMPCAREVQRTLGLDYAFANTLETDRDGLLTGQTVGAVVTPHRKQALLAMIAQVEGCQLRQTIAVGDGSNDIPMLNSAGLGVAYCAKPKVQAAAEFRVNNKDLSTVLFLIGLSETAARRLLARANQADA